MFSALLALVMVAFPSEGRKFPYIEQCYITGAVNKGETNVVVNGSNFEVYRTGAWGAIVPVVEGENTIEVVSQDGEKTNVTFTVAKKPPEVKDAPPPKPYEKLEYAADAPKAPPKGKEPKDITVVIDAGHGGSDTGAVSPHGHFEKEANLLLARRIRRELEELGFKVVMTRDDDSFPALFDRPKVAHRENADAFISVHHNAPPPDKDVRDFRYHAVYYWNEIGEKLAGAINAKMAEALGDTLVNNGVVHANFAVMRNSEIPSCLIEADFVSHPAGEEASWDGKRRILLAKAVAEGFKNWCESFNEEKVNEKADTDNAGDGGSDAVGVQP